MKRCPQCEFIYPDTDNLCDFDQTPLVPTAEAEIAALTNTPVRPALADLAETHSRKFEARQNRKLLPIAASIGLGFGLVVFGVYFAVQRQMYPKSSPEQVKNVITVQPIAEQTPVPIPESSPVESPTPESSATTVAKSSSSPGRTSSSHTSTSAGPVSTSNPAAKAGSKSVIVLTSGGRVEADEVWRTKEGVWYRRDGVVTLVKKNRVKAIVSK